MTRRPTLDASTPPRPQFGAVAGPARAAAFCRRLAALEPRSARRLFAAAGLALGLSFVPAPASAGVSGGSLIETGSVYAPRGFTELCARRPEFCAAERAAAETGRMADALAAMFGPRALGFQPPALTPARLESLKRVNAAVNAAIRPVADAGADHWDLNPDYGDCEEYVLMKREMLARLGWPRTALRITVVKDAQGYHAILVAETDKGGFVLDNMVQHITTVQNSPYEFVVAQSVKNPGDWVRVQKG